MVVFVTLPRDAAEIGGRGPGGGANLAAKRGSAFNN